MKISHDALLAAALAPISEHVKTIETVFAADCYFGECEHEEDCPTTDEEVCLACSDQEHDGDSEDLWLTLWAEAERNLHLPSDYAARINPEMNPEPTSLETDRG